MNTAGIDVSDKTVTLVISQAGHTGKPREFKNTPQGHLAQVIRVCFEATGLDDAALELMVINPKAAKRFAQAMQTRTKTDAVDAALLAEFAHRMPFEPWVRPQAPALAIRAAADQKLQHIFDLLVSVTGIAAVSAIQLLGELLSAPR